MVRDVEVIGGAWCGLETLLAVPGHVLDGQQRAVGEEEEVQEAVADDGVVGALDDGREGAESRGDGFVRVREEVRAAAADEVVGGRDVELSLDIGAVEVVVGAGAEGGESHLVPEIRAVVGQVVDVEARVDV